MTNRFGVLFSCFRFLVFVLVSLFVDLNTGGGRSHTAQAVCVSKSFRISCEEFRQQRNLRLRIVSSSRLERHKHTPTNTHRHRKWERE